MSTKIYNGYRLAAGTDIWEFTHRLRTEGNKLRDKHDLALLRSMDKYRESQGDERDSLMSAFWEWAKTVRDYKEYILMDPARLDICFYMDRSSNDIYCTEFVGPKMQAFWESLPEVEEFGYWNNTDPVEGVSEETWEERAVIWKRLIGPNYVPASHGLNFALRTDGCDGMIDMIYRETK